MINLLYLVICLRLLKLLENIKDRLKILCIIMNYQMALWRGLIIRLKLLSVFLMDIDLFVTLEVRFFLFLVYFLLLILIKNLRYSKEERLVILDKRKELKLNRKNKKKAILFNIA